MKHSLLRKLPGLCIWKATLRNDSSVKYSNKITTTLSFKQQHNLWKSSFPPSVEVSLFLYTFDVLDHYHQFTDPFIATFHKHYTLLPTTSPYHRWILLEVSSLFFALNNYGNFDPFCTPIILQWSVPGELPIVIDTGASMSIIPILSDFTGPIKPPDTDSLGSLTDVRTPVQGQGPISWHVEDINGVQSTIDTVAY